MLKLATKFKPEADAMERAAQAGFEFAELWLDEDYLERWETIARHGDESGLKFGLHFPNRGDLSERTVAQAIDLYRALNCSAMVIHTPMLQRYGQAVSRLGPAVRLGVENHRLSPDELDQWASENRWLTLDVEHLWKYTLCDCPRNDLVAAVDSFLDRFGEKLIHVHLPGYVPGYEEHRPMYCSRDMVLAVWDLFAEYRFDGLVVGESNRPYQNRHELRMDVLLFEHWKSSQRSDRRSVA